MRLKITAVPANNKNMPARASGKLLLLLVLLPAKLTLVGPVCNAHASPVSRLTIRGMLVPASVIGLRAELFLVILNELEVKAFGYVNPI